MLSLLFNELRMHRSGIIGWTLVLGLWGSMTTLLFPSISEQFAGIDFPEFYEAFGPITSIGELSGFLALEVFNFAIPIALGIYALVLGTAALGGEEDQGTLELLMALPISRWKLVLTKTLSMMLILAIIVVGLCFSIWIGIQAIQNEVDIQVSALDLAYVALQSWLLVVALGMIALFLGAYLPERRHASMFGALILAASYLVDSLAEITEQLDPYQPFSLNYYYNSQELMVSGLVWEDAIVLAGVLVVFLVLALVSFERRNVTVDAWPWQRPQLPSEG